jgi:pantothenate kinase-related protein Tda10
MYSDKPRWRDEKEGHSYENRRMYMEAKEMKKDKATQMRELEKYMQELSQDITDMISDASSDEKAYLEKKITALAAKIGQMK